MYATVDMSGIHDAFLVISIWGLVDQGVFSKFSSELGFDALNTPF